MVVLANYPVRSALWLVLTFFATAVLWMMLQAEFLALALIFVYVGAVMTLFLFVVMMLNVGPEQSTKNRMVLPFAAVGSVLLFALILLVIGPHRLNAAPSLINRAADYSNVSAMGMVLYTHYLYAFEVAAVILLVAMIAAISLAFFGRKPGTRSQKIGAQHRVTKNERLRVIKDMGTGGDIL